MFQNVLALHQVTHPLGRAQFLHPVPQMPMGRAHTIFPTTNVSSDTGSTSGAGRGGKLNTKSYDLRSTNRLSHFVLVK